MKKSNEWGTFNTNTNYFKESGIRIECKKLSLVFKPNGKPSMWMIEHRSTRFTLCKEITLDKAFELVECDKLEAFKEDMINNITLNQFKEHLRKYG